jgi:hypothetical protein
VAGAAAPLGPGAANIAVGAALLIGGALAGNYLGQRALYSFSPAPGISTFALFYVFAQALERFTELVSIILPAAGATASGAKSVITKQTAVEKRDASLADALNSPTPAALKTAAEAQALVDRIRANRGLLAWTFTSAVAMTGAGLLGLKLIASISSDPPHAAPLWLDTVVTGLAIGGGTKPLHDLIAGLQESRKSTQDPPAVGGKRS